jgi:YVTN family beta-propeller protein
LYFVSDKLYALNPDGTSFAPAAAIGTAATGPVVDDFSGLVYVAVSATDGGFDLMSFNKLLQNGKVALHVPKPPFGGGISPLLLGDGAVYFGAGRFPGVAYAAGAVQWSNPVCPSESGPNTPFGVSANGPALSADGSSLFVMCAATISAAGGLFRLNAFTGEVVASVSSERNSTEPALDSLQHVRSGWQAFGGAVFCGDYLTWDFSLTLLSPPSTLCDSNRFTTSRAAILPDGRSTVRIGFSFPPNNQLDAEGANNWIISTDNSTVPNFSSLPSIDAAGNVFIGNTQGIQARNALDGHVLWSFTTGDAITTQPVVANGGALYVGSSSGKVYAFNASPTLNSGTVYLTGAGGGFITVDLRSATVAAKNGFTDSGAISVSPDGSRSYVSGIFGLNVVDNATNQVIATVPVGARPAWNAISPDGSRVYVTQPSSSEVFVVDTATNSILASILLAGPQRVAVAPDNSRVYVGSNGRGIAVIDPVTSTITHLIDILGSNTTGIAFTPDSAHAYVGEINGPGLYLIDARTDTFLQPVSVPALGGGIGAVVASPDGKKIYAANVRTSPVDPADNVFVLDTSTNSTIGQIPVSFPASQMAITSDGANVLVGDSDIGELVVASIATDSVVETIHANDPCCPVISGVGTKPPALTGSIKVTSNLASAHFSVTGPISFSGTGILNSRVAPAGSYSIIFDNIIGFLTPAPQSGVLAAGGTLNFTGTYISDTGNIVVTTNLERATFDLQGPDDIRGPILLHGEGFSGSFANVPSGRYQITFGGQPPCYAGTPTSEVKTLSAGETLQIDVHYEVGFLLFPISGFDPCSHTISSVFDHSQTFPYSLQKRVTAYTGEAAGCVDSTTICQAPVPGSSHFGFLNIENLQTSFAINGNYTGGAGNCEASNLSGDQMISVPCNSILFYNGHPGYDYPASCGTNVFAAANGTVHYPKSIPGIADAKKYHILELDLDAPKGFKVYYLHLATYPDNHKNGSCEDPAIIPDNTPVKAGDLIGLVGKEGTKGAHLHFEVQFHTVPVDPYGWKGSTADPYPRSTNQNLWK